MSFLKSYFGLWIVFFISLLAIVPLFQSGFFPMHDDTQVARVYEMGKALKDGMFPVRWVADLGYGYGYPLFNFYAPLAYYFGGMFNLFGFDALISTKIMMGFGMIFAGISMYLLARQFWGEFGGIVSGLMYVFAPYHAVQLYVRGDVAELWAYAFIPLAFWGFYKIFITESTFHRHSGKRGTSASLQARMTNSIWKWTIISSVGYASIVLSHNLTALMVTPFLIIVILLTCYIVLKHKKPYAISYTILAFILGVLLSAFYWLPVFAEMKYTNVLSQIGGGADFKDHFVCFSQLWNSPWGFGGSTKGCLDGISFKIGKLHILFAIVSLFPVPLFWKKEKRKVFVIGMVWLLFLFSIYLTLDSSQFLWNFIKPMAFFQYPWRFLILISFAASFLSGAVIWFGLQFVRKSKHGNLYQYLVIIFVIGIIVFQNLKLFTPQKFFQVNSAHYTNDYALKWDASKISDEYMPPYFTKPPSSNQTINSKLTVINGSAEVLQQHQKTQNYSATLLVQRPSKILLQTAIFPAWKIFVNGRVINCSNTTRGYLFPLPPGNQRIEVTFVQTPIERVANILSLAGIAVLIIGIIYSRKRLYHE